MWPYEHVNRDDIIHYGALGMKVAVVEPRKESKAASKEYEKALKKRR